ncbi:methyltransferase domain-containing protein [Nocardia abscessus]|uniref:methyltransferase domain-containing protein n=1 Tax=Nocardia abscessus TaxID=120957 RepID=UPI002458CB4E|nr:methyltransferase domain-containing protein [Nocardia abscessus]
MPFGAESFDAVLCERVFQHLTAPARAAAARARPAVPPPGRAAPPPPPPRPPPPPPPPPPPQLCTEQLPIGRAIAKRGRPVPGSPA